MLSLYSKKGNCKVTLSLVLNEILLSLDSFKSLHHYQGMDLFLCPNLYFLCCKKEWHLSTEISVLNYTFC